MALTNPYLNNNLSKGGGLNNPYLNNNGVSQTSRLKNPYLDTISQIEQPSSTFQEWTGINPRTYVQESFQQVKQGPVNWIKNAFKVGYDTFTGLIKNTWKENADLITNRKAPIDQRFKDYFEALGADILVVASPMISVFSAASQVPGLKQAVDSMNLVLGPVGKLGGMAGEKFVDVLPIPEESKNIVKPAFGELTSTISQFTLGAKILGRIMERKPITRETIKQDIADTKAYTEGSRKAVEDNIRTNHPEMFEQTVAEPSIYQEARKYKSAEEFAKGFNAVYFKQKYPTELENIQRDFLKKYNVKSTTELEEKGISVYEANNQYLIDIWNKANAGSKVDPLIVEVRKYKTAEEFVNKKSNKLFNFQDANQEKLIHSKWAEPQTYRKIGEQHPPTLRNTLEGTGDIFRETTQINAMDSGYIGEKLARLESYIKNSRLEEIKKQIELNKNNLEKLKKLWQQQKTITPQQELAKQLNIELINNNIPSVQKIISRIKDKSFLTKSQLIDIWNKANMVIQGEPISLGKQRTKLPKVEPVTIRNEIKLSELDLQIEQLKEIVKESPLRKLAKHESKQYPGRLTEDFQKYGDRWAEEAGINIQEKSVNEIAEMYEKYVDMRNNLNKLIEEKRKIKADSFKDYTQEQLDKVNQLAQIAVNSAQEFNSLMPEVRSGKITKGAREVNRLLKEHGWDFVSKDEVARYTPRIIENQKAEVNYLLENNPEKLYRMALNKEPVGELSPSYVWNVAKLKAWRDGNIEMMRDLARSPLSGAKSLAGSELRLAQEERLVGDPIEAIKEIEKIRSESIKPEVKTKEKRALKEKILEEFIKNITC